ncbi:lantibiotic dehydratase family protein [Flavobacterium sp.]|uniref:lantibiotic dehydratase family protein n=1 Tax=Flavobacterium sp. TaxID=239 RepID=UPI00286D63B0|nr:lantibiotic dehydratase family protein [Flavobacterium sp.]
MFQIHHLPQYILRTPAFQISNYLNLLENYSVEALLLQFENPYFREAIKLASPELVGLVDKWKQNPNSLSNDKKLGLESTLLKYISRISSRCTPFGTFAGCAVGEFAENTDIKLNRYHTFSRHTQFDMHFWVAFLQDFAKRKDVMNYLIFYPNTSLYSIGDFYRYVEYKYINTKREHSVSAIRKSELLELLLNEAKNGTTINKMTAVLADNEAEKKEALVFIYQLIEFQFLVSNLEAGVTGNDEWAKVLNIIENIPDLQDDKLRLLKIKKEIENLDITIVPKQETYSNLKSLIEETKIPFEEKYLFQVDLNLATSANTLNQNTVRKVQQALFFLNGMQKKKPFYNLFEFIKKFTERYETREMPLSTVLDTEISIGYIQNTDMNDVHDILDVFSFRNKSTPKTEESWTNFDYIIEKKLQDAVAQNRKIISLIEKDFPEFDSSWHDTPATFSVMVEIFENYNKEETVSIVSSGSISAAKLSGRFCNGNAAIHHLTNKITEKEKLFYNDKMLAEIVHIPESRTGNVLRRPVLRDYEIAYLSNSGVAEEFVINISDLMVSVKGGKIILRSKRHNKEVIPCLSNAHNFSSNSLPIYHFLCDMQMQNLKPIYDFSWGILQSHYNFFPRVVYKEVILSKAKWIVNKSEIESFFNTEKTKLLNNFQLWRSLREIPQYINWTNGDNTLLLDLEKEISVNMFINSVKNLDKVILEEFLFTQESVVKNEFGDNYTNQFILSFYKEQVA